MARIGRRARATSLAACGVGVCLTLAVEAAPARAQAPETRGLASVDSLSPVEMMEEYRSLCGGEAGRAASGTSAEAARTHGQRCDALARAIQGVGLDDRRAGSADLARPDFYTPGEE